MTTPNERLCAPEDWARTYEDHAARLRRLLRSKLRRTRASNGVTVGSSILDTGEVEDLVQDAFMRALATSPQLDAERLPLLFTIAKNRLIDLLRQQRRRPFNAHWDDCGDTDEGMVVPSEDAQDELLDRARDIMTITRLIAGLPADLMVVYEARFIHDLPQRDAAARLGITRRRLRTLERRLFEQVGQGTSHALDSTPVRSA